MPTFDKNCCLNPLSYQIYTSVAQLPAAWNELSKTNVFLSTDYLSVLEIAKPHNMRCFFIALYDVENICGIAVVQFLDLSRIESFGDRDSCLKTKIRNIVFKNFSSRVLFVGNNMLTGQNAFSFNSQLSEPIAIAAIQKAIKAIHRDLSQQHLKPHLEVWKDFSQQGSLSFEDNGFTSYFRFRTQPNMIFDIDQQWPTFDGYLAELLKKYRDQYKRARKKSEGIAKRKMSLEEIDAQCDTIHKLYMTVAENAPFNTFYLPKGHFYEFKKQLHDRFLFYGYFEEGKLIGFNTLIKNGKDVDTYFLGYDNDCQRDKMLYLNMLYDMIAYSVNKSFSRIIFARTALEIKSSVGAKPVDMFGFIKHNNPFINYLMPHLFRFFEPTMTWNQRHPFKD